MREVRRVVFVARVIVGVARVVTALRAVDVRGFWGVVLRTVMAFCDVVVRAVVPRVGVVARSRILVPVVVVRGVATVFARLRVVVVVGARRFVPRV